MATNTESLARAATPFVRVFALTLLDGQNYTVPPALLTFVQGFNTQWNVVAAASIIVSIPVLIGLAYIQKYFVQGLTGGAIKG